MEDNLRLVVLESMKEFGDSVNEHLARMMGGNLKNFIVPVVSTKFNNGEGKAKLCETIRNMDVFILSDVGNHSITYNMYDYVNHKSPDDHFQDIIRTLCAIRDHSCSNSVIMPLMYESRQHRRSGRESLDCAVALQELVSLKVKNILTFDIHDVDIANAIPTSSFESFHVTKEIIESLLKEEIDFSKMFVLAPDTGAMGRANLYTNLFKCDMGFFRKARDTSKIVDGKNPITEHKYVGSSFKGKNVIVVDDMIASGESILDVAKSARKLGASKVYLISTFSLFTRGVKLFDEAYEKGIFDKVITTNLTYFDPEYRNKPWLETVDCTEKVAKVIYALHNGMSLSPLLNETAIMDKMIEERLNSNKCH